MTKIGFGIFNTAKLINFVLFLDFFYLYWPMNLFRGRGLCRLRIFEWIKFGLQSKIVKSFTNAYFLCRLLFLVSQFCD